MQNSLFQIHFYCFTECLSKSQSVTVAFAPLEYQMTVKNNRAHLKFLKNKVKEEEREKIEKRCEKLKKTIAHILDPF